MTLSPVPVETLRGTLYDQYQRRFPRERASMPAVIVGIDENSLELMGQWPWPRDKLAELIDRINTMQPAAIGLDLLFGEHDATSLPIIARRDKRLAPDIAAALMRIPSNDEVFAASLRTAPSVLAVTGDIDTPSKIAPRAARIHFDDDPPPDVTKFLGHQQSIPELVEAVAGQGLINADVTSTVVRRTTVLAEVVGKPLPALSVEMFRVATGSEIRVGKAARGVMTIHLADTRIPIQSDGTMWIRFGEFDKGRVVSAATVMTGKADPEMFANKLVLIGATGLGLLDHKTTPLGQLIPGVDIHAQMIEQIFDHDYLLRPTWLAWLEVALLLVLGSLMMFAIPRLRANRALQFAGLFLIALGALGLVSFRFGGVLLDVAWPALGMLGCAALALAESLASSERMRRVLREQAARLSGELTAAKRIQMGLLPDPQEVFSGEHRFVVAATLEPARSVGGDFYDCFMLDEDHMFFIVADVSGKGLPAALFMAASKSVIKSAALQGHASLSAVVQRAQADIARENPEALFVTAFVCILDARNGRLTYVNAGHEPPYVRRPGSEPIRLERAEGPPLGTMDAFEYSEGSRQMQPGEWICVVTDGVTEGMNPSQELFGNSRLRDLLAADPALLWPGEIVKRVQQALHTFADGTDPADDLTLLAMRWAGAQGAAASASGH